MGGERKREVSSWESKGDPFITPKSLRLFIRKPGNGFALPGSEMAALRYRVVLLATLEI